MNISAKSQTAHLKTTWTLGVVWNSGTQVAVATAMFQAESNSDSKRSFTAGKRRNTHTNAYIKRQFGTWTMQKNCSRKEDIHNAEK